MRRKLSLFLAVLMILSVLAGCGGTATPPADEGSENPVAEPAAEPAAESGDVIELDMYFPVSVGGGPDALITALCEQFHAENPGIKINPVYAGTYAETRTKVQAAIKGGNTPAIALMFSIDLYSLLSMDVLYDYNSFCTTEEDQAWLSGFYDGFMQNSRVGETVYGIPWQRSTILLYYNKDAFNEVGLDPEVPPETWDDLVEYAEKLVKTENGVTTRWGIQIPSDKAGYAYWMLQTFCNEQSGFNLMSGDGKEVYFNDPRTIKALSFWRSLSDKGLQAPGTAAWSTTVTDFLEQKSAMVYHTTGNLRNVKNNATFDFGTAMLPMDESRGSPTGGGNFYLFKGVPEEETQAAFTFIKWMTNNPDRVAQWSIDTGYVATRPEAYETQLLKDYTAEFPQALTARDQLEYGYAEFSVYDQGSVQDILDTSIEAVMTKSGSISDDEIKAIMDDAQTKADAILSQYR